MAVERLEVDVRHSTEKRAIAIALERLNCHIWQRLPLLLERLEASFVVREVELQAKRRRQRFEDAAPSWDDLTADTVARNEACSD